MSEVRILDTTAVRIITTLADALESQIGMQSRIIGDIDSRSVTQYEVLLKASTKITEKAEADIANASKRVEILKKRVLEALEDHRVGPAATFSDTLQELIVKIEQVFEEAK